LEFTSFGFCEELQQGLDSMGFKKPTEIQAQAIPIILQNKDLIACAQTGTGKTAAFILPAIHKIIVNKIHQTDTLVIVPTRELAIQIDEWVQGFAYFANVSSIAIYGGTDGKSFDIERRALSEGANIIIATPGRLIAHLNMGYVNLKSLKHLILDEADRMLDMGFSDDLNKIISFLPKDRQTLMFSATMPPKIRSLANKILKAPEQVNLAISKPAEGVKQGAYILYDTQKLPLLREILQKSDAESIIIFAGTKDKVKETNRMLTSLRLSTEAIHSDLEQQQRNDILRAYKNKKIRILVATDVMSRGIDIDSIGLVVNFDVPSDAEDYVHRVGRTARASSTGEAITLVNPSDQSKLKKIEELIGYEIEKLKVPEVLGAVPSYNPDIAQKNNRNFKKRKNGAGRKHRPSKPSNTQS
jgi:superfamily II DNA/RNA helicase